MTRVINEELAAKITENARLHATLDDIEKQYESTILSLQNRIQELEKVCISFKAQIYFLNFRQAAKTIPRPRKILDS